MKINNGSFVISLDFELMWGVRDVVTKKTYGQHILGVHTALPKILQCFTRYKINATFGAVGLLFCRDKKEILKVTPSLLPGYVDQNLSPYGKYMEEVVGENVDDDPYHYGWPLLQQIQTTAGQEIATHTFSHYYCLEEGQTVEEFRKDLQTAVEIAKINGIDIRSIVFPRNQVNELYLNVCKSEGVSSYRGTELSWIYRARDTESENLFRRLIRLADAYVNLSGYHCYTSNYMAASFPFNIPSSRFLRPYSKKLKWLEWLRLRRIINAMTHAAKNGLTYHLWWHPHNFGINQEANILFLEKILLHFQVLEKKYSFTSLTMRQLSEKLEREHNR